MTYLRGRVSLPSAVVILLGMAAGCRTQSSQPAAGIDLAGMDKSVAPGDDFNAYTNGGWIKSTPIPPDKSSYGIDAILADETRTRTRSLIQDAANLRLTDPNEQAKKAEILSLLAQAHTQRETRIFQANSGIPVPLWCVLIAFTIMLALFVSLSAIQYRPTAVAIAVCFTTGIVSILVIARLLDYPFEGALALRPTDFIDAIGKISDLLNHMNVSEH